MDNWIKIGNRYINLDNVTEVRVRDQPRTARVYFTGGGIADLDEDDTSALLSVLNDRTLMPKARKIVAGPG